MLKAVRPSRGSFATCDGFDQLRAILITSEDGLADALRECIALLLFAPRQWFPTDQAREFCNYKACIAAVQQLQKVPTCMWVSKISPGSDANTLSIAKQVMQDSAT
ncbi:hypothetical protein Plhal703r1_c02g0008741 [Plasmopara halstedii]